LRRWRVAQWVTLLTKSVADRTRRAVSEDVGVGDPLHLQPALGVGVKMVGIFDYFKSISRLRVNVEFVEGEVFGVQEWALVACFTA